MECAAVLPQGSVTIYRLDGKAEDPTRQMENAFHVSSRRYVCDDLGHEGILD